MKLPRKITPCPIVDSSLEVRFKTDLPHDAIFGIIYNSIKDKYQNFESLPILQLPEPVRRSDPNLKFKPHYKVSNENYVIQIGSDVISIGSYPVYSGWGEFQKEIESLLKVINGLSIVSDVMRIGLRVINFFSDAEIFSKSKISIKFNSKDIGLENSLFRSEFEHSKNIKTVLNMSNNSMINSKRGSLIDMDTFIGDKSSLTLNLNEMLTQINTIHSHQKEFFFSLLQDEFIKKFNPEY